MRLSSTTSALLMSFGCALFAACSRSGDAPTEPAPPAAKREPASLAAEAQAQAHAHPAAPEALEHEPAGRGTNPGDARKHMWAHYLAAIQARDAIIGGHRERAAGPLEWLSGHAYPDSLPDAWRPHAVHLRRAAKRALESDDTDGAARAIGSLGAACGACHEAMGRGPEREPTGFSELSKEDLQARMHRHGWAMERMWEGLVIPWDESYRVGAQVFAEGKLELEKSRDAADLAEGLAAVRALGKQAMTIEDRAERGAAYGDLIARCAGCHAAQGVELDAVDTHGDPIEVPPE